ncbi:MAG: response regulator [Cyanobacteria bacterium]|nr:response regulator [Cyanobacteriota bacterium]
MIVEDNASVAKYFRYVLEHDGYAVAITESGDEAVRLARDAETVAVLVDISLRATQYEGRYIDGLELSRILKDDESTTRVPVIIATAHVMSGDRERFLLESKADGFLRKPIVDPQEVLSLLSRLTRHS